MSQMQDDELTLLWQQGTSGAPDAGEIARLAGRASLKQFDRSLSFRNMGQYAAGLLLLVAFGWNLAVGRSILLSLAAGVCVVVVVGSLWWQHRDLKPLDLSADARAYHSAMLARIDKQLDLLRNSRFWYLMPLCIPSIWAILENPNEDSSDPWRDLVVVVALFAAAALLNEKWGIQRLRAERAKIESLYEE
jgi:hypothetical protein